MIRISVKISFLSDKKKNDKELDITTRKSQKSVREALTTFMRFILKNCDLKKVKDYKKFLDKK